MKSNDKNVLKKSMVSFENPDYGFKIIVVGNSGVGKTSFIKRVVEDKFDEFHDITIITDLSAIYYTFNEKQIKIQLWDTCGLEQYRSINKIYYKKANAAILMHDLSKENSLNGCEGFIEDIKSNCSEKVKLYLIGSKTDLLKEIVCNTNTPKFIETYNIKKPYDISSKTGIGVFEAIEDII